MSQNPHHKIIKPLRDLPGAKKGLWLNNLKLKYSLKAGDKVRKHFDIKSRELTIEKSENANHTISYRKSDKNKTPILDIKSQEFTNFFKNTEKVEICFYVNKITVKIAKIHEKEVYRKTTNDLTTFELFCGGGTFTQFFNQNGFHSVGGLELQEKYLSVFQENNKTTQLTICASLADLSYEDYPKNVSTLLAGIPCTKLSKGNVQMINAQEAVKNGTADEKQIELVKSKDELNLLTYKVIEAAQAMNARTVVVEEVPEYTQTPAYKMLKMILESLDYKITEAISEGSNSKRKRWTLVANMNTYINLDNLTNNNITIQDCLEKPIDQIDWKPLEECKRMFAASQKPSIGLRANNISEQKANAFTTHGTRHTEPGMKHPTKDLYAEFSNNDIASIHGLKNFKLSGVKTVDRQILGQGVTDMFGEIAKRIKKDRI